MVRAYFAATMKVEELGAGDHLPVCDNFNDTENTAFLLALQGALFSRNRIFLLRFRSTEFKYREISFCKVDQLFDFAI